MSSRLLDPAELRRRRVILLDAGGTLITLQHDRLRTVIAPYSTATPDDHAFERAESEARRWADVAIRSACHGRELWDGYFSRLLLGAGIEPNAIAPILPALWAANRALGLWRKPIAGARGALAQLVQAGYRLAVVSNAEGQVESDLREAGLADQLETVVDSHVVGVAKPDPGIFQIALERLGVSREDAFYVGDVPAFDVVGAHAAGLPAVLLDPHEIHTDVEVAARLPSLAALPSWLGIGSITTS